MMCVLCFRYCYNTCCFLPAAARGLSSVPATPPPSSGASEVPARTRAVWTPRPVVEHQPRFSMAHLAREHNRNLISLPGECLAAGCYDV